MQTILHPLSVMTGLVPVIHDLVPWEAWRIAISSYFQHHLHMGGFVYLMSDAPNGTLYCGVTNDIARRAYEHRTGQAGGFTRRYSLKHLVWFEEFADIREAIQRETSIKRWPRAWKVRLIQQSNPEWCDLYETLA